MLPSFAPTPFCLSRIISPPLHPLTLPPFSSCSIHSHQSPLPPVSCSPSPSPPLLPSSPNRSSLPLSTSPLFALSHFPNHPTLIPHSHAFSHSFHLPCSLHPLSHAHYSSPSLPPLSPILLLPPPYYPIPLPSLTLPFLFPSPLHSPSSPPSPLPRPPPPLPSLCLHLSPISLLLPTSPLSPAPPPYYLFPHLFSLLHSPSPISPIPLHPPYHCSPTLLPHSYAPTLFSSLSNSPSSNSYS